MRCAKTLFSLLNRCLVYKYDNLQVIFHPATALDSYKNKGEYTGRFDVVWVANNMTKQLGNLASLAKRGGRVLIESRKYSANVRHEEQQKFTETVKNNARDNGLRELIVFDSEKHTVARFCKN